MELQITDRDFQRLSSFVYEKAGINLHEGKKDLLRARLAKFLRNSSFSSVDEFYQALLRDKSGEYTVGFLDCISTNLTYFFREPQHFDFLRGTVVPQFLERAPTTPVQRVEVWSAGCSSGEEPYSIVITLLQALPNDGNHQVHVLATDISTRMLAKAARGIYEEERLKKIPLDVKRRYFKRGKNRWAGFFKVKPILRQAITFRRFNLMEPFPSSFSFHVIFCRNVMIYFDKKTQERLVQKFYDVLRPGGYLFIGHSESLTGIKHSFQYIKPSIYQKPS